MTQTELFQAIASGALYVPFILAIVAGIKTVLPDTFPSKYFPGVSMTVGILFSAMVCTITVGRYDVAVIVGMFAGLMSSGLYQVGVASQQPPRE